MARQPFGFAAYVPPLQGLATVYQPLIGIEGNPDAKEMVVWIEREEVGEQMGSGGIEGAVRRLLTNEPEERLRRREFKILPMVCLDGVTSGA